LLAVFKMTGLLSTLSCLVLAGFSLVQWFTWPDASWPHLGWFTFAVLMSCAPWLTQNRGNGWAMLCMSAMGAGGLWFGWQRLDAHGPLVCKATDTLCRIAEGVRSTAGDLSVAALFALAGLGMVAGGVRYAMRREGNTG
jgi:hypothetical protein